MPSNAELIQDAKKAFGQPHFDWNPRNELARSASKSVRASWIEGEVAGLVTQERSVHALQELVRRVTVGSLVFSRARSAHNGGKAKNASIIDYLSIACILVEFPGAIEALLFLAEVGPFELWKLNRMGLIPEDKLLKTVAELYRNDLIVISGTDLSLSDLGAKIVKKLDEYFSQDTET